MRRKKEVEDFNGEAPLFDGPDDKILAFDMFRGVSPGIFSDVDLDNPAQKIEEDFMPKD